MKINTSNIFFLILLLSSNLISFAQASFQFQNSSLKKDFEKFISADEKENLQLDSLLNSLEIFLLEKGFINFNIEIDSSLVDSIQNYFVRIREGKRYIIKSIKYDGDTLSSDELAELGSMFEEKIFNQKNINNISLYTVDLFEKKGYPFAEVKFLSYRILEETDQEIFIEIILKVKKNELARISKVEIKGNRFTNRDVIIREMRISEYDLFTPDLSKKILLRLNRLNIFSNLKNPEFFFDENKNGILEVEVEDGNTNSFDGIIGYVPSSKPEEKGYLKGQVNISLRNLFGTLRAFSFRWNRLNQFTQDIEIKYFEPWLFGYPINVLPSFSQLKQDTTYIQRTFGSYFEFFISEHFGLTLNLITSEVIPQTNYFVSNVNRSSSFIYGLGVIYDSRDHPIYTKSGIYLRTDLNQVIKKDYSSSGTKKFFQQKGGFLFSLHQSIFKNQLIYFSLNAKMINGNGISISDLFKFGGMNSLRGYEENQFSGNRIFWTNIEYRLFTSYTDFVSAFFDYGYYFRDILNEKVSNFKYGYGVGASFQTALGLLKINFALGEGDTFSRGKIHFGIVSGF